MELDMKGVSILSKTWEDNIGTHNIVNSKGPLMTTCTKNIRIKYYWFLSKIISNEIEVNQIKTDYQRADIFSKGFTTFLFEEKQKLVM